MTRLRCRHGALDGRYCALALHHLWRQGYFQEVCNNHVSQASVGRAVLLETRFPLPPLSEQRRIVTKAVELSTLVRTTHDRLTRVPLLLKQFRQAVLAAACSGKLTEDWRQEHLSTRPDHELLSQIARDRKSDWKATHQDRVKSLYPEPVKPDLEDLPATPRGWDWASLDQIGQEGRPILYGIIKPGPHIPDGVPYVRVTEMKDGHIEVSQLRRTSVERAKKFERAKLEPGDVLISKDGTIGRVAVVPPELKGGNITQHVMRVPVHRLMERDYVVAAIRGPSRSNGLPVS